MMTMTDGQFADSLAVLLSGDYTAGQQRNAIRRWFGLPRLCEVNGCSKPHLAKGMCSGHRRQMQHHGTVSTLGPRNAGRPKVDRPTYSALHRRVRAERGRAAEHACEATGCTEPAAQWVYDGLDGSALTEAVSWNGQRREVAYSLDVHRYVPLCRGHHVAMDRHGADVLA